MSIVTAPVAPSPPPAPPPAPLPPPSGVMVAGAQVKRTVTVAEGAAVDTTGEGLDRATSKRAPAAAVHVVTTAPSAAPPPLPPVVVAVRVMVKTTDCVAGESFCGVATAHAA